MVARSQAKMFQCSLETLRITYFQGPFGIRPSAANLTKACIQVVKVDQNVNTMLYYINAKVEKEFYLIYLHLFVLFFTQ